jgi:hypothetical protein
MNDILIQSANLVYGGVARGVIEMLFVFDEFWEWGNVMILSSSESTAIQMTILGVLLSLQI